jgi:hypothetical protein
MKISIVGRSFKGQFDIPKTQPDSLDILNLYEKDKVQKSEITTRLFWRFYTDNRKTDKRIFEELNTAGADFAYATRPDLFIIA